MKAMNGCGMSLVRLTGTWEVASIFEDTPHPMANLPGLIEKKKQDFQEAGLVTWAPLVGSIKGSLESAAAVPIDMISVFWYKETNMIHTLSKKISITNNKK